MRVKKIKVADILIKFIDEQYIDSTTEKGFFFNTLDTFKVSDGLTDEQHDLDEGALVDFSIPQKIEVIDIKSKKQPINIPLESVKFFKRRFNYDFALKIPICCFTLLRFPYDFDFVKINKNVHEYKIKGKIINQLEGISLNRPYVWCLEQDMIKGLNEEIRKGRKITARKVKYYEEKNANVKKEELKRDLCRIIFMKNSRYKNQKEFRIAVLDRKENCFLHIKDLPLQVSEDGDLNNLCLYINQIL